jgi:uncharacterized protein YqgC (DUF456 family)
MDFVWPAVLILVLLAGWVLTLLGMPGNWLMCAAAAVYAWLVPRDAPAAFGWGPVVGLLVLATLGELLELAAGALGAAKHGGSKRGALLAVAGSMVGGIVGVLVGAPIPVVGPLVAALLFAALGAMAGAMLGETWKGRQLGQSWQIGKAAFWGRLLGTLAKMLVGLAMIGVVAGAMVF